VEAQTVYLSENFNSGQLPTGWQNNATGSTSAVWAFGNNGGQNINGTSMAFWDDDANYGFGDRPQLTTPVINIANATDPILEFVYNYLDWQFAGESFMVDVFNGTSWVNVLTVSGSDNCGQWTCTPKPKASINLNAYKNANFRVRFTYDDDDDWNYYVGFDDFVVKERPTCFEPVSFNVTNILSTTARFNWTTTNGAGRNYEIEYGSTGFVPGSGNRIGVFTGTTVAGANFHNGTGLLPNTTYQAYIREKCTNPTSNSLWVGPISFTTTDAFTFQTSCNSNVTIQSGSCPTLEELNLTVSGLPTKLDGEELEIKSVSTVVTMFNWSSQVRLTLRAPNGSEIPLFSRPVTSFGSHIGNPNLNCSENSLCTFADNAAVQINENTVAPIPFPPYIGTWRPVAPISQLYTGLNPNGTWRLLGCIQDFWGNGTMQYLRIKFSDCFDLASLALTNISTNQASFSFNSRQSNKTYVLEYGTPGFIPGSGTRIGEVTGLTVKGSNVATTAANLNPNTNYQAYVRTVCSSTSRSEWIGPLNFKTSFVVTPSVSFNERFDGCSLPFGWTNTFQPVIADPWIISDGFSGVQATYMTGGSRSGFGCFAWIDDSAPGNAGAEAYLTTQALDISGLSLPELNFYWQNSNGGTKAPVSISNPTGVPPLWSEIYVDITTDMGRTYTEIAKFGGVEQAGWSLSALDISKYKSNKTQIRFRSRETNSFYSDLALDDITVRESPNMVYSSSTATQRNTQGIVQGEKNDVIIGIEIDADNGFANPLPVTSFSFNTNGSTNPSGDIAAAKVYYTGTNPLFSPVNQFGTTQNNPNGNFTVNGLQTLTRGKNYFWLTYDTKESATIGNLLDAQVTSITVANIARTPVVTSPAGSRPIVGKIIYITTTGSGSRDGTSWANASPSLTSALSIVVPKQQIWVAQGKYTPGTTRTATFTLVDGALMYGGFIGNETSIEQRSWKANQTILSGDIGTINSIIDNSFHVVTIPTNISTYVDGFVIEFGNANGGGEDRFGAAVFARPNSKPVFNQCWFRNNTAIFGGAILALNASPTVTNSIFQTNATPSGSGGACYAIGATDVFRVSNSIFVDNTAGARGGCVQSEGSNAILENCSFSTNRITLTGTTSRGAVGSALNNGRIGFYNCSSFNNNSGSAVPGDFLALGALPPTGPGFAIIENSILWNRTNLGNEIFLEGTGSTVSVNACIIDQDDYVGINRNQSVDPFFRDANGPDNTFGTPDDNLSVRSGSLAIDSADTRTALTTTLDGFNRDSKPDIGAYEFFPCPVPNDLRLVKGGPTSVEVGWQTGGSNVWDIEYMPAGGALGTGTRVNNITTNPFKISNLSPLTAYQFFVRDNCSASNNGTSFWVGPFAFSTSSLNDECDGAIDLIVSRNCNNFTGSNLGATNSTQTVGFNPSCGSYAGADVWFKATVPASGSVTFITSSSGGINNTGVEVYRGTCGGLTAVACQDNTNPNAFGFEQVTVTGETPGDVLYVRVWQQTANQFGTFNICATRIPVILVNDVETNENLGQMSFTLRLSEPDLTNTITVNFNTSNGTALAGLDYASTSGTVTFEPGSLSKTITIPIIDDNLNEDKETFFVNFSNPTNAILGKTSVTGTILDNDPLPKLSIVGATVTEGNVGTQTINVTVNLTPASGRPVRFTYRTTSNTASAPEDFVLIASTNELFPAGTTQRAYQVTIKGDFIDEGTSESFFFTLENIINADVTNPQAEIVILDDDFSPIAQDDLNYNVDEDDSLTVDRRSSGVGANDSDPDGQPLTFFLNSSPNNGVLQTTIPPSINFTNDGTFRYTPDPDYWSNPAKGDLGDQFTYRAFDGYNFSNVARARIRVQPVNDAPVLRSLPNFSLCAGQQSTVRVNTALYASDIDDNIVSPDFKVNAFVVDATNGLLPTDLKILVNPFSKELALSSNVKNQGSFTVRLVIEDKEGLSASKDFKVNVGADLKPSLTYSNSCLGSQTLLRSTSTSVDGLIQFTYWDFDNDGIFDDEGFSVRHIFKQEGNNPVKMRVVNEFGCQKDSVINVVISPQTVAAITQNRERLTSSEGTSYQWFFEGQLIPAEQGGTQRTLVINKLGKYQVRVTNSLGCTKTSEDFEVTTLDLEDISASVKLYPNPATDFATLEMSNDFIGNINISLTDISGRLVSNETVTKKAKNFSYKINTAKLASGIYIVQMKSGEYISVHKLEKE
jgi:hypothetical protein